MFLFPLINYLEFPLMAWVYLIAFLGALWLIFEAD